MFEYQAPKDDSYKNFHSQAQFIKRYLLLFPVAFYCAYQFLFIRKNKFSERKEFKVINKPFETHVLGPLTTKRIANEFKTIVYKQDTEETKLIRSSLQKIVKGNFLSKLVPGDVKVKVLHNEGTVGLFMSLDQTLFVTVAALRLASMDEASVALLVSHELAHFLMDHQVYRLALSWFRANVYTNAFKVASQKVADMDPIRNDFKARTRLQAYSCFYPQQRIVSKFMERNCDALAMILWKRAYPDVDHEQIVQTVYGEKLGKHLRYLPHLDERETYFD